MFPQHLQITDKRTCWHGNAGGKLEADPKNVVSAAASFSFFRSTPCAAAEGPCQSIFDFSKQKLTLSHIVRYFP